MATEQIKYVTYGDAVQLHIRLMRALGETRFGIFERSLVESALARPRQAAIYENADILRQAATLLFGLVKNHPFAGGNKRTATFLMLYFLRINGYRITALLAELVELTRLIDADELGVSEVATWLANRASSV